MKTHKDLIVWQKSIELVTEIYRITSKFPKEEIYGITSQIRRSSVSVPSNIAEGAGRKSNKEFIKFLHIALGSLSELETQIIISNSLKYLDFETNNKINTEIITLIRMLTSLIAKLKLN